MKESIIMELKKSIKRLLFCFITFLSLETLNASNLEDEINTDSKLTVSTKINQTKLTPIPDYLLQLPEGITVKKSRNGYGIFAVKDFEAGEITHYVSSVILPYDEKDRIISFKFPHLSETLINIVEMHAVPLPEKNAGWTYYGVDSFINHSCLSNSLPISTNSDISPDLNDRQVKNVATRNIKAGEEITTNYNLCYWDLDYPTKFSSSSIIQCNCQQLHCIKEIKGFAHLSQETKNMLAPFTYPDWPNKQK